MADKNVSRDTDFPSEEERRVAPLNEDTGTLTKDPLTDGDPNRPSEITENLQGSNGGRTAEGLVYPTDGEDSSSPDQR